MDENKKPADEGKTPDNSKGRAMILGVIGIILFILGLLIVTVHGFPLRGSGAGTIFIILGIVLLVFAGFRAFYKRPQ